MNMFKFLRPAATTHHAGSSKGIPLVVPSEKRPRRRMIRRIVGPHDSDFQDFPRFGPLYALDEGPTSKGLKEMAWQHVIEKAAGDDDDDRLETTEKYLSAIRDVEREAMECYEEIDLTAVTSSETEFRWMMLKDGCFLLQLAFMILGGSSVLDYPEDHILFGRSKKQVDTQRWIKSMFYAGNQIPLVVLRTLTEQPFFRYRLLPLKARINLEEPSDLFHKALYEFLLFPNNNNAGKRSPSWRWQVAFPTALLPRLISSTEDVVDDEQTIRRPPSDLLHGLQSLVVCRMEDGQIHEDNLQHIDLEQGDDNDDDVDDDGLMFSSATELRQGGIHFKNVKGTIGNGGRIYFRSRKIWGFLFMPTLTFNAQTFLVFYYLKRYERTQHPYRKDKREVCGYLKFMSELVRTKEDVRLLADKGIISVDSVFREKLPRFLGLLSVGESSEYLRRLRIQINEFSQPTWWKYKEIVSVAFFLTVAQTVLATLSYVHDLTSS